MGVLPLLLFSDVAARNGGTALATGSHLAVAKILFEHAGGVRGGRLSELARARLPWRGYARVAEACGEAGDVVLCHPMLLHARSTNLQRPDAAGVRFVCNPCIRMKEDFRLDDGASGGATPYQFSPVERAIRLARGTAAAGLLLPAATNDEDDDQGRSNGNGAAGPAAPIIARRLVSFEDCAAAVAEAEAWVAAGRERERRQQQQQQHGGRRRKRKRKRRRRR